MRRIAQAAQELEVTPRWMRRQEMLGKIPRAVRLRSSGQRVYSDGDMRSLRERLFVQPEARQ